MEILTAEIRRDLIALSIGLFDAVPGALYLNEFATAYTAGMTLSQIANALTATAEFKTVYPATLTAEDFAARLVENLLGSELPDAAEKAWATEWVVGQRNANVSQGDIILTAVQALQTTMVPAYDNAKLALQNKIAVAEYYSVTNLLSDTSLPELQAVIAGVTSSAATVVAAKARIDRVLDDFEILALGTAASGAYSAAGFKSLEHGLIAGDVEFTAVSAGTSLTITASPTKDTTYSLADSTGADDFLALTLTGAAAIITGAVTATGVENIVLISDDSNATPANIAHTATVAGNAVEAITVVGDAGLTLIATSTALTSFDASGMTNNAVAVSFTTGALAAAAVLTGSAGNDTLIASAATKAVTLNGGDGNDTLTVNNANDNTINGDAGDDTIMIGTGSNKVSTGTGNDTVILGAAAGVTTIDVGAGTDTVILSAAPVTAGFYISITGMGAGDKFDFSSVTTQASPDGTLGARITLGGASEFSDYLNTAAAGDADSSAIIKWFQLGGNTYVVIDNGTGADTAAFEDGIDSVVELTGLVDLATATVNADVMTLA